jgi:hypothetical protein
MKEKCEFWDRLLSESGKRHWLSVDWSKWKDEDESDDDVQFGKQPQGFNDFNVRQLSFYLFLFSSYLYLFSSYLISKFCLYFLFFLSLSFLIFSPSCGFTVWSGR